MVYTQWVSIETESLEEFNFLQFLFLANDLRSIYIYYSFNNINQIWKNRSISI